MKKQGKFYFLPKTKLGKYSFWIVVVCFIVMYLSYLVAITARITIPPPLGILEMALVLIFGITSFISIIKYKDYAISLFLSSLIGLLGILFLIGEFAFPH